MTIKIIGFDADDTLWHNEHIFREAEKEFAELLDGYADQAVINEYLLSTIKRNLTLYGFGFKALMLSMVETALELSQKTVSTQLIKDILELGRSTMERPVHLIEGVIPILNQLKEKYRLVLISKGDLVEQESKLSKSGLTHFFDTIEIVSHKDKAAYERITKRLAILPEEMVMVGNSVKSDILPALEIGARAVYVHYDIVWVLEQAEEPIGHKHYYRIDKLGDLPNFLDIVMSDFQL